MGAREAPFVGAQERPRFEEGVLQQVSHFFYVLEQMFLQL